jgi:hypothetical protein
VKCMFPPSAARAGVLRRRHSTVIATEHAATA